MITHGFVVDKDTRKKICEVGAGDYTKPMDAEHFVGKYGADIVRLWASSVEFTNEVPFSEESFTRARPRRIGSFRNILRILLANLARLTPARSGPLRSVPRRRSWIGGCSRACRSVIETCREAYAAYEFRKVFQTLNQFVTVDVSALYVDITKDRMYCDAADSPRRRATQAVMREVFERSPAARADPRFHGG